MSKMFKCYAVGIASVAVAGVLAFTGGAHSAEMLALQSDNVTSQSWVVRNGPAPVGAVLDIGTVLRIDGGLVTRDGTDLLLFGQDSVNKLFWRIGRGATAGNFEGDYHTIVPLAAMTTPVTIPATINTSSMAWVGDESRHLALLDGGGVVFYEAIPRSGSLQALSALPLENVPGWGAVKQVPLPGGFSAIKITQAGPRQLFVIDGSHRIMRIDGPAATECKLLRLGTSESDPQVQVQSIVGLPEPSPPPADGKTGALAAVSFSSGGPLRGAVVPIAANCSGTIPIEAPSSEKVYDALSFGQGLPPLSGFGSGVQVGSTTTAWLQQMTENNLVTPNAPVEGGSQDIGLIGNYRGVVTTSIDGASVLIGGKNLVDGYLVFNYAGTSFSNVSTPGITPRRTVAALSTITPKFGLSGRLADLSTAIAGQRVQLLQVFGTAGHKLKLHAGTCTTTTVTMSKYDTGSGMLLDSTQLTPLPATIDYPVLPAGQGLVLLISQLRATQDCNLVLASDPSVVTQRSLGGGAMIHVQGSGTGQRAMAMVLDKSGSMSLPINGDPTVRANALKHASLVFGNVVNSMLGSVPPAENIRFGLIPFDSNHALISTHMGADITGNNLLDALNAGFTNMTFAPGSWTNIREALLTRAGGWFNSLGAAYPSRTILLMTDGRHNWYMNGLDPGGADALEPAGAPSVVNTSQVLRNMYNVKRLYAIGLSPTSEHQSLERLANNVNGASGGIRNYTSDANQLTLFFLKALWDYVGVTPIADPVVPIADTPYTLSIPFNRLGDARTLMDRDLAVSISWNEPGMRTLRLRVVNPSTGGALGSAQKTYCRERPDLGTIACWFNLLDTELFPASLTGINIEVSKAQMGGPALNAVVEVAGRTAVRVYASLDRTVAFTNDKVLVRAVITELGLPVRGAKNVRMVLTRPSAGLGTALANAQISADAIKKYADSNQDAPVWHAKLALMKAQDLPKAMVEPPVELRDDGKSGDGLPDDGIYGAVVPVLKAPGAYSWHILAEYQGRLVSGSGPREAQVSLRVQVGLDGKQTIVQQVSYTPPTERQKGTLVLKLKPQDALGNLLGPGNAGEIVFYQDGQDRRMLPAVITEPPELDGTYDATISEIALGGAVKLQTSSGGYTVIETIPTQPGEQCTGCCCDLSRRADSGWAKTPAAAFLLIGLLLIRRRVRRRR